MATAFVANAASNARPANSGYSISELTINQGTYTIAAALVVNDTIALCKLPANHIIVDCVLTSDDLDTDGSPAIVLDVGIIGGDADAFIDGSTIAQGSGVERMNVVTGTKLAVSATDRSVGVLVQVAPATGATTGTIKLSLLTRSANVED